MSKWNTYKVNNMSILFFECYSLFRIPDLSIWNAYNVTNMSHLFSGCNKLLSM